MNRDDRIDDLVGAFLQRLERGERPDPEEFVRAEPGLADALRERLAVVVRLDAMCGPRAQPADARGDLAGQRIGRYRLESLLGSGGMGSVYLAADEAAERSADAPARVAVKVVHPQFLVREGSAERFRREAELGRRVRHANVVRTLDVGEADSGGSRRLYLVMEHVEGRTLRDLADEAGRVPEQLCRHIGREIAQGLAALHAAGAVHRDLKPENVIITASHEVKVMDLGVAWLADEAVRLSQTGAFVGSLLYGAPEQFRDGKLDGRADLHALGLVIHELATGEHPFAGDDFRVVVRRLLDEKPRRLGVVNPQISPFLEELVAQLLEKDLERRPASAAEVATILDQGEESAWWKARAVALRRETRRPLRRIRIPRETALYGRETEIARLRALFEKAKSGDGQAVLVEGEAGIGKSRLVDEFVMSLWTGGEDVDFLFGSYPPGGAASSAGAFSTAYREHLGDDEAALREALPQTPSLVPAFAALLRGEVPPDGAEKLTKESIQTVFVHLTRSFAARRTTIVLIDDLHFAPEEGRALFTSLALAAPGHRVLLIGGARPSLDEKWAAAVARLPQTTRLPLARLSPKELVALLEEALKSEHLATELAGKIAQKSDGNPFFVFEILRGLREGQFLTRRPDGTWITTRAIQEIEAPPSIVEVIQARVSDLDADERNALEVAACAGFEFDAALVGAVLGVAPIPLLQRLGRIEKAHRLVRSVGHLFAFDHHQVQEVLYAGLSAPLREAYHAAIAEAIETRSGAASKEPKDLDGAVCVELAENFVRGAQAGRGLRYLDGALTHLESRWLSEATATLCDRWLAVPSLLAASQRAALCIRKSARLDLLGRHDADCATIDEAIEIADRAGDGALRAQAWGARGRCLLRVSRYAEAESALSAAIGFARTVSGTKTEAWVTGNLGLVLASLGRYPEARERFERSLALSRETGDRRAEANALGNLGNLLGISGQFAEARDQFERVLALARELHDRRSETIGTGNVAMVLVAVGRFAEAREQYEWTLALARATGDRREEIRAIGNLALVMGHLGYFTEQRVYTEQQLALQREIGSRDGEAEALGALGATQLRLGNAAVARRLLEQSLELSRAIGTRPEEGAALELLGELSEEEDEMTAALRLAEESLTLRETIGDANGVAESLMLIARVRKRLGSMEAASSAATAALTRFREQGRTGPMALALALSASLPGGDVNAAVRALAEVGGSLRARDAAAVRFLLWQATRDRVHLIEAKRLLDFLVEHAPPDCRETMLTNVRLHREIMAAWRAHGADDGGPAAS